MIGGLTLFFCGASRLTKQTNQSICCDPASRNISCERVTEAAASVFIWCDTLELQSQLAANPTSYGANTKHTCTYLWCNKGRLSLWILWCNLSTAFSYQPRLCQRLRPNGQLLFLSCRSYASLQHGGDVLSVHTHTQTQTHGFPLKQGETHNEKQCNNMGCIPTSPLEHTQTYSHTNVQYSLTPL